MEYLLTFIICNLLATAYSGNCTVKRGNTVTFTCTELTNLTMLDTAEANTTVIEISNSDLPYIHGHAFTRFAATLVTLDLHGSGIETIDALALVGLTKLEKLILWNNKLRTVPRDWFMYLYNLRTLDLSFNFIEVIDYAVFQMLPNLENFFFDYNQIRFIDYTMFAYLKSLKNVKFEKNPLSWGFRAHLTWQLENQRVKYTEQWEDWGWMNVIIKECTETGYEMRQPSSGCTTRARQLVQCMTTQNRTRITDNETVRKILEDYTTILVPMSKTQGRFSTVIDN
ncbi:uncharacterized protein LOC143151032 [Ptiloglossa arizonensis]|uniref:uncharacterized protein LOC143151032 n=1 Tax=Ptiloglossa arizonensis TaxID=3350558 RepID=UPI003F9EC909